eukprot:888392-Pleurochrysis_carterae.AAC.1
MPAPNDARRLAEHDSPTHNGPTEPKSHARGLLPEQFRNAEATRRREHVTCYNPSEPQLFEGTSPSSFFQGSDELACAPWADFIASSS